MPRYFFHFEDGQVSLDEDGTDCPDLACAREEALATAGQMLRDTASSESFWSGQPWRLWVTDGPSGSGETLFTLRFSAEAGG